MSEFYASPSDPPSPFYVRPQPSPSSSPPSSRRLSGPTALLSARSVMGVRFFPRNPSNQEKGYQEKARCRIDPRQIQQKNHHHRHHLPTPIKMAQGEKTAWFERNFPVPPHPHLLPTVEGTSNEIEIPHLKTHLGRHHRGSNNFTDDLCKSGRWPWQD